eukprot:CAMPEP_0205883688 /NCGR_PEP_ID=MMETSP1083-20121108/17680_1 /ASSEMBLY_ACC=CAM_ASM_000430 /TAXON_ID=97485 /ORGANISM="Prymnesium parvum, Strain Texoma1" /LENGTH=150 /DNA_ID=CAMNT_0053246963 /DNA_START=391 /DNA_END=843 /DNA_ORIENTATION=+
MTDTSDLRCTTTTATMPTLSAMRGCPAISYACSSKLKPHTRVSVDCSIQSVHLFGILEHQLQRDRSILSPVAPPDWHIFFALASDFRTDGEHVRHERPFVVPDDLHVQSGRVFYQRPKTPAAVKVGREDQPEPQLSCEHGEKARKVALRE